MGRNQNPYQSVDWDRVQPLCGCTHMHCVNDEQFQRFVKQGLEFVTLANYHPSVPWYPLKDMRKRSLRTGQKGCFRNGSYIEEYTDFTQYSGEDPDKGGPVFSHIPENLLEAPNAEHHWFSDYNVYLHISAPGSYMASGYPDVAWNGEPPLFDLQKSGFQKGFQKPWKEAFSMLLDRMISPDGGGVIINHPVWSHMPIQDILDMLDMMTGCWGSRSTTTAVITITRKLRIISGMPFFPPADSVSVSAFRIIRVRSGAAGYSCCRRNALLKVRSRPCGRARFTAASQVSITSNAFPLTADILR